MTTSTQSAVTASVLPRLPAALGEALRALRSLAQNVEAWLEARKRAREDRELLTRMSDRELFDIGIARSSVDAVARGTWVRDHIP